MRVLVTRPQDVAEQTAVKLAALGHEAVLAPLLTIQFRDVGEISLDGVQAILITSANGIRALARGTARRDVKVLAVGTQSAETARALGFTDVEDARGDAQALAELANARLKPEDGMLLHASGAETLNDFIQNLRGFIVPSDILYDAVAAEALPRDVTATFGTLDAALFFSPRTARIFPEIVAKEGLSCHSLRAFCISKATADELTTLDFREVRVAAEPNQDALLALLG